MTTPFRRSATVRALGAIALWSTFAALAVQLARVPPFLLVGATLLVGGAVGLPMVRLREVRFRALLLGVYGLFTYHLCLFVALRRAPPVEANLLNYLWPLLVVVLGPLFVRGMRLGPRHLAGALLGFAGAALLVGGGTAAFGTGPLDGYLLALAAAVIWSTWSLATSRLRGVPTAMVSPSCLVAGALALACHAALEPRYLPTGRDALFLAVVGVGPMGVGFYLWDRAMKDGDPRVIGTLAYLTPVLSTLLLVAAGEGRLGPRAAAAMALVVGGSIVGTWPARA
jgi:drug/metabolite transporter (DMT)-like permease